MTEAAMGVMCPQAKGHQKPPVSQQPLDEAGGSGSGLRRERSPADSLILDSWSLGQLSMVTCYGPGH